MFVAVHFRQLPIYLCSTQYYCYCLHFPVIHRSTHIKSLDTSFTIFVDPINLYTLNQIYAYTHMNMNFKLNS